MAITQQEIEAGLRELGLKEGDIVLLHSSLSSLGEVERGAEAVVDAFLSVLGASGTLVAPTTSRALGVIPETLKQRPAACHSIHPRASVAALGAAAEEICRDHWKAELAHGPDTPYVRIAERGGYVCLMGVDQDRNTTLHTAEELLRLPYLKPTVEHTFDTPEGRVTKSWPFFPGPHRNFIGLDRLFRGSGRMRIGHIGNAVVRLIRSSDLIEIAKAAGEKDPAFALCDNPNCGDCVRQRADIRRHRFSQASFTVAASACLAGRTVDEIVEQCGVAGVDAVELDDLGGTPVSVLGADVVLRAVERLRGEGRRVTALRAPAVGQKAEALFRLAREANVPRVVLPLSGRASEHAALAGEAGVAASFFNVGLDSPGASDLLLRLRSEGSSAGFTFHAAHFARAGEMPFLGSYKQKLRRFVDQLDVEDALYDGTPQPLGHGNAEVKEMISILSASGFSGCMVLGQGNRLTGTLLDAVRRFEHLLDTM